MKKILSLLMLLLVANCAFAQKRYLEVVQISSTVNVYGELPDGVKDCYAGRDFDNNNLNTMSHVLNLLADYGYNTIESYRYKESSAWVTSVLLSKTEGNTNTPTYIQRVQTDPKEEITEVARYNLQGIPVKETEKGVQVIVYSNYTTKTVIVE